MTDRDPSPAGSAAGPWDAPPETAASPPPRRDRANEPAISAPLPALALALSMPLLFWWFQVRAADPVDVIYRYGLVPARLWQGEGLGLIGAMGLHAGWGHVAMNAIGALAFGAPVSRLFNRRAGVIGFVSFYAICGILAGLGYAAIHPNGDTPLIGASGAVFGLIGAATRMLGPRGRLMPLTDRRVWSSLLMWTALNVGVGLVGSAVLGGVAGGGAVAWEAHIAGLVAGALLIGPFARVFSRPLPPRI